MTTPFRRIATGIILFVIVCIVAVIGYVAAGWELMDSVYMVIITIFGVGYGEVQPVQSPGLRALTIAVIVLGYAAVIYTVGGFVQMLIDGEIRRVMGARRMTKDIEKLKDHAIVCGFGRMGSMLARALHEEQRPFVVVEREPQRFQEAEAAGYLCLLGDATEETVLEAVGIRHARVLATVLSEDSANVFITITARDLNPALDIIARGEHPSTEKKLLRCGASKVILPTAIGAAKVAQLITRPTAESVLEQLENQSLLNEELGSIGLHFDELRIQAGAPLVGHALSDIVVRGNQGFLIVGLRRADGTILMNPSPDTVVHVGDVVIVLGHRDDIPQLVQQYALSRSITYRGATLTG